MADPKDNKDALTERFSRAVKDARERAGMSQAALAEAVGSSLDHVGKLERGKYLPGLQVASQLIRTLGLDANALLDAQPVTRNVSRRRLEKEAGMIRLIETLDDRTLDMAILITEALASRSLRERR